MEELNIDVRDGKNGVLKLRISNQTLQMILGSAKGRWAPPNNSKKARFILDEDLAWRLNEKNPILPAIYFWTGDYFVLN